jgi:membrane protease YdiL (CAAX protease family)
MPRVSQSFPQDGLSKREPVPRNHPPAPASSFWLWFQIALAYALLELSLWTRPGRLDLVWMLAAALCISVLALSGRYTPKEMGLGLPPAKGTAWILLSAVVLAAMIPILSALLGTNSGPTHTLPFHTAWRYAIWSLLQQFILQSFFFLRLETLLGPEWAVPLTAAMFAAAHIPSPVLMILGFFGGLFFCEMFRRYRNIFPLGLAHALFGLTIAASFSDRLLHHMRVGIGYLMFRP